MTLETALALTLIAPAAGAVLIWMSAGKPNQREGVTLVTATALFALVVYILTGALDGVWPAIEVLTVMPGLPIAFAVEPLGMLFALLASFLWIVNSVYSIGYMRGNREGHQTRFYVCFAGALVATMGVAFAANMFTLFLAYEALTLVTYPLVTHAGTKEAVRGGRTYLGILLTTSIALLLTAVILTWQQTGTLDFTEGGVMAGKVGGPVAGILLFLYMFGIGKAALMPFHRWLPAAMVAPTPVSALLHAVAVVKAGVFTVVKVIVYLFGLDFALETASAEWLPLIAGFTILAASVFALRADHLKRRLAFSTVSQLSYVVMSAALLTPLSIVGAALHIFAHGFGKITLFFAAGAIHTAAHKDYVSQLDGIGRRMPWTMGAFAVGALSMIGLPPTAGFVSKWYILLGAYQADHMIAVGVIVVSTILNAAYFLPIVYRAFFRAPPAGSEAHGEAPLPIVLALTVTAAGTLLIFVFPEVPFALARELGAIAGAQP